MLVCLHTAADTLEWYNKTQRLRELTVISDRGNDGTDTAAKELMKKVIASRDANNPRSRSHCSYDNYTKMTLSVNDIDAGDITSGFLSTIPDVYRQVEFCPYNNKLILPIVVMERISHETWRLASKAHTDSTSNLVSTSPDGSGRDEVKGNGTEEGHADILLAERSAGINTLFQSGEMLTAAIADFFPRIDIYGDYVKLLQRQITSPIGRDALSFYTYAIIDTLLTGDDQCRCIRVRFAPSIRQNFGFSGEIYVTDDTTHAVRRVEMSISSQGNVNFIDALIITQEYERLPDGGLVLTTDDMAAELSLFDFMKSCIVVRTTRLDGYDFSPLPNEVFTGDGRKTAEGARERDEAFWEACRRVPLTSGERHMVTFMDGMRRAASSNAVIAIMKAIAENYIGTGTVSTPGKADIGPINAILSSNSVDGIRLRIGGQTTAHLHPRLFFNGYYAHAMKSDRNYYNARLTYSLNDKRYLPSERLKRNISFSSTYDIRYPSQRTAMTDDENIFHALRWTKAEKMTTYHRQRVAAEREERCGLTSSLALTVEEVKPAGTLSFSDDTKAMKTTEIKISLRYAPRQVTANTKNGRKTVSAGTPVFTLSHATGISGLFSGHYAYNITDASASKRLWMGSYGKIDVELRAAIQWSTVPFPLLPMPQANFSYITRDGAFNLMRDMEFLADRYVAADVLWDLDGRLLNHVPLLNRLKWRERVGVKVMWGTLTDKNNPTLAKNAGNTTLMPLPDGSYPLRGDKPYIELSAGIHNILRFFGVEYVRRLTYTDLPTAEKQGVRLIAKIQF